MYLFYFVALKLSLNTYKGMSDFSSLINNLKLSKQLCTLSYFSMNVVSMIKDVLIIVEEAM